MKTESRVTLDLSDNPELQAYFKNRQPGDDYSLHIKGKIIDNTPELFAGDVESVVEDGEAPTKPDEAGEEEPAVNDISPGVSEAVNKAVGRKAAK